MKWKSYLPRRELVKVAVSLWLFTASIVLTTWSVKNEDWSSFSMWLILSFTLFELLKTSMEGM